MQTLLKRVSPLIRSKDLDDNNLFVQEITTSRARFPKAVSQYEVLTFFGRNIIATEGDEWKKYRKISAPAFSDVSVSSQSFSDDENTEIIC